MFYLCRNVQLYALQSLLNIFAGCRFFSPAQFFFCSHLTLWAGSNCILNSSLTRCFVWILVGSSSHAEWFVACTLHTPTQHSSDDTQFRKNWEKHTFLLDLIHLHFTWENCDDNTEFLPFSCPLSLFCFYF